MNTQTKAASDASWQRRVAELWKAVDGYAPDAFIAQMDALAKELPPDDAIALFERGSARDSVGKPAEAVVKYRAALAAGLSGSQRRQATIQLASSLRNLGHPAEAVELLQVEMIAVSDDLDGAVRAFLALALADLGREREGLGISLAALAHYLPRYNRSLARYAADIEASGRHEFLGGRRVT